jgi:two-component system KDP operon response regulator KdpE
MERVLCRNGEAATMQGRLVLLVALDPDLRREVQRALANESAQVVIAGSAHEALQCLPSARPDLILLNGSAILRDECALCRQLRDRVSAPILIIGGAEPSASLERALLQGADDFVLRPIRMGELLLRARVLLQRSLAPHRQMRPQPAYTDGRLHIDADARRVSVAGQPIHLTSREFELLAYLYRHAGQVLTLRQILENVWGWECCDNREYVHAYVNRLRRKLEPDPAHPVYLLSEFGVGYRFERRPVTEALADVGT